VLLQKSSCFRLLVSDTDVSHGSVATYLRCGGIFSDSIITNVLLIQTVNKFENRSMFDEVKAYEVKAYEKCASFMTTLYSPY